MSIEEDQEEKINELQAQIKKLENDVEFWNKKYKAELKQNATLMDSLEIR